MNKQNTKNDRNKHFEDYEDGLWKLIMYNYAEYEGKELLEEKVNVENDPQFQPSDIERKRFNKMLDSKLRKNKMRSIAKTSKKVLVGISVVVLVFILGFGVLFTTVEAFRVEVLNFLLTFEKEYASVKLGDEKGNDTTITAGVSNIYVPSYIPDGYWIDKISNNPNFIIVEYINNESIYIKFNVFNSSVSTNIDIENAEIIKSVKINGADGLFVLKDELTTISWSADEKIFIVYAELSEEEIVKIAESVIFIK